MDQEPIIEDAEWRSIFSAVINELKYCVWLGFVAAVSGADRETVRGLEGGLVGRLLDAYEDALNAEPRGGEQ